MQTEIARRMDQQEREWRSRRTTCIEEQEQIQRSIRGRTNEIQKIEREEERIRGEKERMRREEEKIREMMKEVREQENKVIGDRKKIENEVASETERMGRLREEEHQIDKELAQVRQARETVGRYDNLTNNTFTADSAASNRFNTNMYPEYYQKDNNLTASSTFPADRMNTVSPARPIQSQTIYQYQPSNQMAPVQNPVMPQQTEEERKRVTDLQYEQWQEEDRRDREAAMQQQRWEERQQHFHSRGRGRAEQFRNPTRDRNYNSSRGFRPRGAGRAGHRYLNNRQTEIGRGRGYPARGRGYPHYARGTGRGQADFRGTGRGQANQTGMQADRQLGRQMKELKVGEGKKTDRKEADTVTSVTVPGTKGTVIAEDNKTQIQVQDDGSAVIVAKKKNDGTDGSSDERKEEKKD